MGETVCRRCGVVGAEHFAPRASRGKTTFQAYCRPCQVDYHREWRARPEGRAKVRASNLASRKRYPERARARYKLRRAIMRGNVVPRPCYVEGCAGVTEAHHDDYSKPLEVTWTCRAHHRALDKMRGQKFSQEV